jgi:hypothetical protein
VVGLGSELISDRGYTGPRNVTDLQSVHLQLDADAFIPSQRSDDAKEVLGARVTVWPKHPLQARRGDPGFTGEFAEAYRGVDVVTQDSAACSKVTIVDELEPFTKKALAKSGFALCAFTDRIAEISRECHSPSSYLRFFVLFSAAAFASACFRAFFLSSLYSRQRPWHSQYPGPVAFLCRHPAG